MKSRWWIALVFLLLGAPAAQAQKFLMTETVLDSLKPGTVHGAGDLAFEFKRSASVSVQLATGVSLIVPTYEHQFRLDGNFAYNLLDTYSNDNKGYAGFNAYLFQFEGNGDRRHIKPLFVNLYASYNYDYVRKLHDRVMTGVNVVWQPLQDHEHLYLEAFMGPMFSYQNWRVLQRGSLAAYDSVRALPLPSGGCVGDYYGISPRGFKDLSELRLNLGCELSGNWNRVAFSSYLMMQQAFTRPYRYDAAREAEIREQVQAAMGESAQVAGYLPDLNHKAYPTVFFGGKLTVRLSRFLSLMTTAELFYDGGQLPASVLKLSYSLRQGLSVHW